MYVYISRPMTPSDFNFFQSFAHHCFNFFPLSFVILFFSPIFCVSTFFPYLLLFCFSPLSFVFQREGKKQNKKLGEKNTIKRIKTFNPVFFPYLLFFNESPKYYDVPLFFKYMYMYIYIFICTHIYISRQMIPKVI